MEKQEIFEQILVSIKSISPDKSFDFNKINMETTISEDLDFDSISLLMLGSSLEESFNIHPTDKRISNFTTVGDIVEYVYHKVNR